MENAMKILHLEDNLTDSQLTLSLLKRAKVEFEYFFADNEEDYLSHLENQKIDLILSDYHLPDYSGKEALQFAKTNFPHIPFVFVSGTMGEEVAIDSLLNGATDYVLKNKMERLVPAIHRAFNEAQEQKARQKAEKALLESELNFRHSISESPLGIRIVTIDGKTIYTNKAFLDIYEFSNLEEFTNTAARDRYTDESYVQHLERKARRKKDDEILDYELSIVSKNGKVRHVKVARKEVLWNGTKHFQVLNQNITEQKKLTAELIAAKEHAEESDRLKSAFLANISHEIRTPMNGILGFTELLKMPDLPPDVQERYIHIIEQSGNRLLHIINDLVDISKIEAGQISIHVQETNVNKLLQDIHLFFTPEAKAKGLSLSFSTALSDEKSTIQTDHTKLTQVLTNLINNAIKFTKSGSVEFGYELAGTSLTFYVKDTGVGIPANKIKIVFERFRQGSMSLTRAYEGAGLGLSISKAFVELLGGKIWVESLPGKGSAFFFRIPSDSRHQVIRESDSIIPEQNLAAPIQILFVEDDEHSIAYVNTILANENVFIFEAVNGEQAVELVKNHPEIDLVLMDLKMPKMDGFEATLQIKQLRPTLPVIAQTAYIFAEERDKAKLAGCDDYITKPIKKQVLLSKIQEYILK